MSSSEKRRLIIFFILTFSISWSIWIISGILFRKDVFVYNFQWLCSQIGVFAPTIVAVILMGIRTKESREKSGLVILLSLLILIIGFIITLKNPTSVRNFDILVSFLVFGIVAIIIFVLIRYKYFYLKAPEGRARYAIDTKWLLVSIFFLPLIFLLSWLIINVQGIELQISAYRYGFARFIYILLLSFSMNFMLGGSMGEEFGWRGYALPLLLKKYNPNAASLILGSIWAFWHLPIDITSDIAAAPVAIAFRIIWALPLTIIFTWFFIKTNGSIIIVLFLHTSVNVLPDLGFNNYENSIVFMTILLIAVACVVAFRPEMRRSRLNISIFAEYKSY